MNSGRNQFRSVLNRWSPTNTNTNIPRASFGGDSGNTALSDRWVEDAGFFRLQNLQIGYTFDSKIVESINLSRLRVYGSLSNVFVLSPFDALDPENDTTPFNITLGFNVSF